MAGAQRFEAIDPRLGLCSYAALAVPAGFALLAWGQIWLGSHLLELPWGKAALIRMAGAIVIAAGLCALGLAAGDARTARRGLSWFIAAHGVVWLMLVVQIYGPWGGVPLAGQVSWALLAAIMALFYVWQAAEPRSAASLSIGPRWPEAASSEAARSRYEQQIRDAAAQEERNRLARDLHDAVKQQIFAIQTSAATVEARFDDDPAGARAAVGQVRQSAREAMSEMEAMLDHLRVVPLENTGLVEAIRKQCDALAYRTGADVTLHVGRLPPSDALEPGAHQAVFRVVQEALANIARHARARHVTVSLDSGPDRLTVRVEDDGVGVQDNGSTRGMGIQNMRARAAEIKGTVEVGRAAEGGTVVLLAVPCESVDSLRARRRQALTIAVAFGVISAIGIQSLLTRGFSLGTTFLIFGIIVVIQHAVVYWRLRRTGHGMRPETGVLP